MALPASIRSISTVTSCYAGRKKSAMVSLRLNPGSVSAADDFRLHAIENPEQVALCLRIDAIRLHG